MLVMLKFLLLSNSYTKACNPSQRSRRSRRSLVEFCGGDFVTDAGVFLFSAELSLDDFFNSGAATTTKAPPKVVPKGPAGTKAPAKPKPKPAGDDFNLADALDPNNDIGGKDKNKGQGGEFSDSDLIDVSNDDTYKPDKGKETTAEVGTIAGIVSAVAMALVGAVSSYISYQKKKFCFSIQQSLNTDMVKAENPDAVVAAEPQVQQTLLEPPHAEPPTEENAV
ncbi:CD99 antigen-like protein 2 [Pholidichthys leucotaenia]